MKLNDALAAYNKSQDDEMNGEIEEGENQSSHGALSGR